MKSSRAFSLLVASGVVIATLTGCSEKPAASTQYQPALEMMQTMNWILDPAADVIWSSSGWDITAEGERELWPTTDEGWTHVLHAAATVTEAGNLLMIPGRIEGADGRGEDWNAYASAMTETGKLLITATQHRDKQAIFDLGGQLYNICRACHSRYAYPEQ